MHITWRHVHRQAGANCTDAKLYFWQIFQFFIFYPNGTWTHPPTSKLFLDFWKFFNFAKPLTPQQTCARLMPGRVASAGCPTPKHKSWLLRCSQTDASAAIILFWVLNRVESRISQIYSCIRSLMLSSHIVLCLPRLS